MRGDTGPGGRIHPWRGQGSSGQPHRDGEERTGHQKPLLLIGRCGQYRLGFETACLQS